MVMQHGGNIWGAAARYGGDPSSYTDFSANINPLGPPDEVWPVLRRSLEDITRYPEPDSAEMGGTLAAHFGISASEVVVGNGAAELIDRLPNLSGVKRVLVPHPTFAEYEQAARRAGKEVVYVRRLEPKQFQLEPADLLQTVKPGDMVFLCRPNNPTGTCLPDSAFFQLVETLCERGARPVVDESFLGFVPGASSVVRLLRRGYPVVVVYSLTKLYALPGLRLGCTFLQASSARELKEYLLPWRVNALAAAAGPVCLEDDEFVKRTQKVVGLARQSLYEALRQIPGIRPLPGKANFLLLDIRATGRTSSALTAALARKRILIRDAGTFPYLEENYVRVAVRREAENRDLVIALSEVVES